MSDQGRPGVLINRHESGEGLAADQPLGDDELTFGVFVVTREVMLERIGELSTSMYTHRRFSGQHLAEHLAELTDRNPAAAEELERLRTAVLRQLDADGFKAI